MEKSHLQKQKLPFGSFAAIDSGFTLGFLPVFEKICKMHDRENNVTK